ncbi:hypothetical protein SAMN05216566_11275 [Aureimonas phyllosphaerae]|nr:hypothetical protein SAMN05216566_11275 [Aureimonas phyllosphaerae]
MKPSALSRLLEGVGRPNHDKRPSIETFADLDVNRVASELSLEAFAAERGAREEPPTGSVAMDEVEARIVERVEAERKASHALVEDQLRTYAERLAALDFEERFSGIRQAAPACIGEFKAEVAKGLNDLHGRRRDLREAENEHDAFRRKHRLERTAQVKGGAWHAMKWALLAFLLLIEAVLNGSFLSVGNEQGLLGGVTEALSFAFLNIGAAFMLARLAGQLSHRSILRKVVGLASGVAYVALAVALNLALAHYREIKTTVDSGAGRLVMDRLRSDPAGLADFNSWVFFGIGILFSVIAFADSLSMTDPYPGFAGVQKRLTEKREEYSGMASELIDGLSDIRDRYQDEMKELNRDLSVRRGEHDVVLTNRSRMVQLFDQHQTQLERAGNTLLGIYREANVRARQTKAPKRFAVPYKMERVSVFANTSAEWDPSELRQRISETQELLTTEVVAIHAEFENAVRQYRSLDDLVPDERQIDGAQPA